MSDFFEGLLSQLIWRQILQMTLLSLMTHLSALVMFVIVEVPKKVTDLVLNMLCEFVEFFKVQHLGPNSIHLTQHNKCMLSSSAFCFGIPHDQSNNIPAKCH